MVVLPRLVPTVLAAGLGCWPEVAPLRPFAEPPVDPPEQRFATRHPYQQVLQWQTPCKYGTVQQNGLELSQRQHVTEQVRKTRHTSSSCVPTTASATPETAGPFSIV